MRKYKTRFQDCNFWERLWRQKYYWKIPFDTWYLWKHNDDISFKFAWSIAIGTAQCEMNWVYDWEEVFPEIQDKTTKN